MGKIKGCINQDCSAKQKKRNIKKPKLYVRNADRSYLSFALNVSPFCKKTTENIASDAQRAKKI